jgi:PIN domain nuclease of toxin-antitoxin system
LTRPGRLRLGARRALEEVDRGRAEAWVPAAVVAEVILLNELGRTAVGLPRLRELIEQGSISFLPVDLEQLEEFAALASIKDPFDRLIVAAARRLGGALITRDESLAQAGLVAVVWNRRLRLQDHCAGRARPGHQRTSWRFDSTSV